MLSQRNPEQNETILSGDLDGDDVPADFPNGPTYAENAYHVVTILTTGNDITVLSGFTISGGRANGTSPYLEEPIGGGILCGAYGSLYQAAAQITRCKITRNSATQGGAGLFINAPGSPRSVNVVSCDFRSNTVTNGFGGGIRMQGNLKPAGVISLTNCVFWANSASHGGGFYCEETVAAAYKNCTFSGNSASNSGGAVSLLLAFDQDSAVFGNCILWANRPTRSKTRRVSPFK